ncbi:hypothetical protein B0H11DRAFT_2241029 [Mycena galericulata]|nr:hypothetical protein B0H11DRAFT_2241029 [Mycena galericulata]
MSRSPVTGSARASFRDHLARQRCHSEPRSPPRIPCVNRFLVLRLRLLPLTGLTRSSRLLLVPLPIEAGAIDFQSADWTCPILPAHKSSFVVHFQGQLPFLFVAARICQRGEFFRRYYGSYFLCRLAFRVRTTAPSSVMLFRGLRTAAALVLVVRPDVPATYGRLVIRLRLVLHTLSASPASAPQHIPHASSSFMLTRDGSSRLYSCLVHVGDFALLLARTHSRTRRAACCYRDMRASRRSFARLRVWLGPSIGSTAHPLMCRVVFRFQRARRMACLVFVVRPVVTATRRRTVLVSSPARRLRDVRLSFRPSLLPLGQRPASSAPTHVEAAFVGSELALGQLLHLHQRHREVQPNEEVMDPDEVIMFFWMNTPAAHEWRKREAEDRDSLMEQWRRSVVSV